MEELDTSQAVAEYLRQRRPADTVRASLSLAVGVNPDQEAEYRRLAKQSGIPVDSVRAFPEDVKRSATLRSMDYADLAERFPRTAARLGNLDTARVAHDDVENMSLLEAMANSFKRGVPGLKQIGSATALRANSGILGSVDAVERRLATGVDPASIPDAEDPYSIRWMSPEQRAQFREQVMSSAGGNVSSIAEAQGEKASLPSPAVVDRVMKAKTFGEAFDAFTDDPVRFIASIGPESLVTSAPGLAAAVPAGIAAGPAGAASALGLGSFATDYGSSILEALGREGVDLKSPEALTAATKDQALMRRVAAQAMAHAMVVGTFDAVSGGVASKLALPGTVATRLSAFPVTREMAGVAAQVPVQGALGAAGEAGGQLAAGRDIEPGEVLAEFVGESFGAPAEVASVAFSNVQERVSAASKAQQQADTITQLLDLAKNSKLRQRDPETFKAFAETLTDDGVPEIFIDPNALAQSGVNLDELAQALPSVAEQLAGAMVAGTDIRIPTAELLTNLPEQSFAQSIIDHAKTEENGVSRVEAEALLKAHGEEMRAEVERVLAQREGTEQFNASRDTVQADILTQLQSTKRFTDDVNKPYAALVAARYATLAQQMQMTPEEVYEQYPLRIQATDVAGESLAQSAPDTPEFNAWFGGSKAVDRDGKPIVVYHGSPDARFVNEEGIFATMKERMLKFGGTPESKRAAVDERGFFFTTSKQVASTYADPKRAFDYQGAEPAVIETYLSIQNPLEFDAKGLHWREAQKQISKDDFIKRAKKSGHDGVVIRNVRDSYASMQGGRDPTSDVYVAFRPEQIKSATGNRGTFDPTDPSILNKDDRRGAFHPDTRTITLLKNADLSTFLHELGHAFLEMQADIANRADAPDAVRADMDALLKWFGVKETPESSALDEWNRMSLDEKRESHETFARGFEAYLFEGKAPNVELQGIFQRFRSWLMSVYRSIRALNVTLTDEVRGVMDRMVASQQQIEAAEAAASMGMMFRTAEEAAKFGVEWKKYHAQGGQATETAVDELTARGLKDMKWLANAKSRTLKALQRDAADKRKEVRREVRSEILSRPVYRAWQFLTGKDSGAPIVEPTQAETDYKLDLADWEARRSEHEADARKAARDAAWEASDESRGEFANARAKGMAKGQWLAKNRKRIELDVQRAVLDWEATHHKPVKPAVPDVQSDTPAEFSTGKLDTDVLKEQYGEKPDAIWRVLSANRMTSATKGLHPDAVADLFGFSSGDEMVQALAAAQNPREAVEAATDRRMLERFGDIASEEALNRAADEAIHNRARARMVATELNALEQALNSREETGKTITSKGADGSKRTIRQTVATIPKAAKQFAEQLIARQKVRDLRPGQYAAAEARATKAADKALRAGDIETAAQEKRNQLINGYASKAAHDARAEAEKAVRYFRKFDSDAVRKSVDPSYTDQIDALLERYEFKAMSNKAIDRRKSLASWVEAQQAMGLEPEIPANLLEGVERKHYKDMTVEELRGLVDTVKQIEHMGRLKNKLLTAKDQRAYEAVRDEIAASVNLHAGDRQADTRTPDTKLGRWFNGVKNFGAAHIKAATWARIFDGGKDGGPAWEYLIRPANERADMETTMRAQATEALAAIISPVIDAGKMSKKTHFPSVGKSFTREAVFAMALNTGNQGNLQRLLGGEGWTIQQLQPILDTLSREDWEAVQKVWDYFESYRPLIAAKERRVYGKEPEWIEPTPVVTKHGTFKGGYYPVKYDPAASVRAEEHADAEGARQQLKGAYTSATTRRSFTKGRVEEVVGRPLIYSLQGIYGGVNEVIHDLAWHEWLIDTNRLLKSDTIDRAIREHYGPAVVRQLKTWAEAIAVGDSATQTALESGLGAIRQNVSVAGLGYNVMTAATQFLGAPQSIARVGLGWFGKGLQQYIAAPVRMTREVNAKSSFMANRARTRFRELNELRNRVQGDNTAREWVLSHAYVLMMRTQQTVDMPTWLGAYEKAVSEGVNEERAIALADQAVIDSQGGGQLKDLSGIERGGPALKVYTSFYSFMNTQLNLLLSRGMTNHSAAKTMADVVLISIVPSMLMTLMKDALTPGDADDEKLWKKLVASGLEGLFGLFVLGREFGQAAVMSLGLEDSPRGYSGPSGLRLIGDVHSFGQQARQMELDDAFRKASINLAGSMLGLPSAQINRTITGAMALGDDKTDNPASLLFGHQEPR